jgi:hypothetical protein
MSWRRAKPCRRFCGGHEFPGDPLFRETVIANGALRAKLLALADRDKRVRSELVASGELFDGYHPRMASVHARNAEALERMIEAFGWPGRSLVGDEGMDAAWLVLQHAIARPDLQRRCLPLLKAAAEAKEAPAYQCAGDCE